MGRTIEPAALGAVAFRYAAASAVAATVVRIVVR